MTTLSPRREAEVLWLLVPERRTDLPKLSDEQIEAARNANALLCAIARRTYAVRRDGGDVDSYLAQVDRTRSNHNLLIDGGRDSGKTALLVESGESTHQERPDAMRLLATCVHPQEEP